MGIVSDLTENIDDILSIRDEIGAIKEYVYILTRKWKDKKGVGEFTDTTSQILPTPHVVDLSDSYRAREGGTVRLGDLMLKKISKNKYKKEDIDCSTDDKLTEKFYKVGEALYEVVVVKNDYVYFDVQVRRTIKT